MVEVSEGNALTPKCSNPALADADVAALVEAEVPMGLIGNGDKGESGGDDVEDAGAW